MTKPVYINKKIAIAIIVVVGLLSALVIGHFASTEDSYLHSYQVLDQKKLTVTKMMGTAAASSAAISLLPGDTGTPIADQLADLSGHFIFILSAICLEKWLVSVAGFLAFRILIPAACLLMIIAVLLSSENLRSMSIKLAVFALILFVIVPASVFLTEKIDASSQASIEQTLEEAQKHSQSIQDQIGNEKDSSVIQNFFDTIKGGVNGQIEKFETTLNVLTETIAVLIVTSCAIPIAVILFFIWIVKLMSGVEIKLPNPRLSKFMRK